MTEDFVIDKVEWHTRVVGNPETREPVIERFWSVIQFLRANELLVSPLAESRSEIGDEFCIRSTDLTAEGLQLMRSGYDRWLKRIDRGGDPADTRILGAELEKLAITRALKRLGWSLKGAKAAYSGRDARLAISFQRSRFDSLDFVNLGIWLFALGEGRDFPKHEECHLQFRLERLFPRLPPLLGDEPPDVEALERAIAEMDGDLVRLTELDHLRELYRAGRLSKGLIRKEARELLA